ncbi:Type III restriction-modification system methylation subunit [Thermodesulfovibrio sp. N1]|uniref:DNA methyltransferase n=1 Tax=Thermodesulfovibrio sp. N1 TaxID=1871110 RepID=UPI00083AB14A|nr:site-specific DNA-methyltransferase [Thermodesulfovibrio sp. N1]ODA43660.1 Type III restriction-modification system methylation subunit [Thermodesulfovibrio sp. N1]
MEAIQKFHNLLKGIFQFEASDLDFGIYRVLNYKRQQIKDFIENTLPKKIEEAFKKHKDEKKANIDEKFEDIKNKINETLGKDAITTSGELKNEFKNTPLGKEFLTIKAQKEEVEKIDEIKLQVFNDLYSFFSRYYEEGDFVPQYRYSIKGHKYAIPYNGEEVKLYWANSEQYYTKTGLLFRDYTFKAGNCKVIFRIIEAKEELSSNKATKERFFVLDDENPIEVKDGEIIIRFQYRELTEKEVKDYQIEGGSNTSKQEKINQKSFEFIKTHLEVGKHLELIKYLVNEIKNEKPNLLYHLNRFSAKNTKDYFIHKNLKRFLTEQLDYFIKSEVLDVETLSQEKYLDKHITRAKTVKEIGEAIIEFLSQIEDFQKRLWEKKKFVLKTEYVITTDRIYSACCSEQSEESLNYFYEEILKNNEQIKEWEELGFEIPKTLNELKTKKLPIDTKYFNQEFKERLLEKLTENADLDNLLDGLLIKSENWQALNTILGKYKEKVQTIYIDPPFNKEQDADYLYNVKYKDSTWVSMLENRVRLARDLLNDRGSIFVRCDYNGNWLVRPLMNEIFGEENFRNEIVVKRGAPKSAMFEQFHGVKSIGVMYDNLYWYSIAIEVRYEGFKIAVGKKGGYWNNFYDMKPSGERPTMRYELYGLLPPKNYYWKWGKERGLKAVENYKKYLEEFKFTKETIEQYSSRTGISDFVKLDGKSVKYWVPTRETDFLDNNWLDIPGYSQRWGFKTENSEILLKRVIESTSNEGDLVMDFFLGSGTTTAVAQKLKRKWIGVEMGEHFWTVVLPRMKKVLAYDKSGISKEKDVKEKYNEKTAGGFFKYQIIEQYEDTLDNIEMKENQKALELFKDEYLLKYFLEFETRKSPYFLNIEHLKNPFAYKLKVNLSEVGEPQEMMIDIPETFNYLLGIKVKKIKKRIKDSRPYLFVLGEKESKDYAIVWREYSDSWDEKKFREDRDFVRDELKEWKPQIVYINGQSVLTQDFGDFHAEIRAIEPDFKRLMES